MLQTFLKSKIHRARVTEARLDYEGSISIAEDLMEAAGLLVNEQVHIWNLTTGSRIETYVIPAPRGTGVIQINGAAAHHAKRGDEVIITSFASLDGEEIQHHKPKVVFVDQENRIRKTS